MKSIETIKDQIAGLVDLRKRGIPSDETPSEKKARTREWNAARKKIVFLNLCLAYLETKPTDDFINSEIERLQKSLKIIDERFTVEYVNVKFKDFKDEKLAIKAHSKKWGVPKIKEQLKTLRFLK